MIVYNVSIKIDKEIKKEWIQWMKEKHIPDVMNTGLFISHNFLKVLNEDVEDTYAIQYFCKDMGNLNAYYDQIAHSLQEEHSLKYKNKYLVLKGGVEKENPRALNRPKRDYSWENSIMGIIKTRQCYYISIFLQSS